MRNYFAPKIYGEKPNFRRGRFHIRQMQPTKLRRNYCRGRFSRPESRSDFRHINTLIIKTSLFSKDLLENRLVRLFHKRLAARDRKPVPYNFTRALRNKFVH